MLTTFTPAFRFEDQYNELRGALERCRDLSEIDGILAELEKPPLQHSLGGQIHYLIGLAYEHRQYLETASGR
jgi:hypothetical protein